MTARVSGIDSIPKQKKMDEVLANHWSSQDQTQVTSHLQHVISNDPTVDMETINTNNFNSKVYNSVQDQEISAGMNQINEGIFGEIHSSKMVSINPANMSQEVQD